MTTHAEMSEAVSYYHDLLAASWTDETAAPSFRPLPEEMPPSYGHCMVSNVLLLEELQRDFPGEHLQSVQGHIIAPTVGGLALRSLTPKGGHIWLHWQLPKIDQASVIDGTADQAEGLPPWIVGTYHGILEQYGVAYQMRAYYDKVALHEDPSDRNRYRILRERFNRLRAKRG